jgi:hypothetical protein
VHIKAISDKLKITTPKKYKFKGIILAVKYNLFSENINYKFLKTNCYGIIMVVSFKYNNI